ncbi:MAG: 2-hydroxyacid dehydrogenase [Candidatus Omnitrophica bacterium]|nr:2-hydroxyacid dehydrogenase [Candidatus Omnitrophota bacterium]MDD5573761.1 2-hydroxyacid dehydrogenase [Candidatus Omnitrophota bacterium]
MKSPRIAFFDTKPYDRAFFDADNRKFGFFIKYFEEHLGPATAALSRGFNAVCIFVNDVVGADLIKTLYKNGVRLIALRCAGYNNVDFKSAFGKIHIVRVPAYSPHAVAEHAVALMLALNRKTHRAYHRTRDSNFSIQGLLGFDMFGKTAGVIGTGAIGRELIRILKGFGMHVLAYDVRPDEAFAGETGFSYTDLKTIYRKSDVISLHCPLTRETYRMINASSLKSMKTGVMLINTGRGKLIDTRALIEALKRRKVGFAGLDVYEEESEYFFEDFSSEVISDDVLARLLTFPNVLVTAHQGFFTREALANIARTTLQNVDDFVRGRRLVHEICYRCSQSVCTRKTKGKCF